jgi:hypothetical protein
MLQYFCLVMVDVASQFMCYNLLNIINFPVLSVLVFFLKNSQFYPTRMHSSYAIKKKLEKDCELFSPILNVDS